MEFKRNQILTKSINVVREQAQKAKDRRESPERYSAAVSKVSTINPYAKLLSSSPSKKGGKPNQSNASKMNASNVRELNPYTSTEHFTQQQVEIIANIQIQKYSEAYASPSKSPAREGSPFRYTERQASPGKVSALYNEGLAKYLAPGVVDRWPLLQSAIDRLNKRD